jgi:hypothetical protein
MRITLGVVIIVAALFCSCIHVDAAVECKFHTSLVHGDRDRFTVWHPTGVNHPDIPNEVVGCNVVTQNAFNFGVITITKVRGRGRFFVSALDEVSVVGRTKEMTTLQRIKPVEFQYGNSLIYIIPPMHQKSTFFVGYRCEKEPTSAAVLFDTIDLKDVGLSALFSTAIQSVVFAFLSETLGLDSADSLPAGLQTGISLLLSRMGSSSFEEAALDTVIQEAGQRILPRDAPPAYRTFIGNFLGSFVSKVLAHHRDMQVIMKTKKF